ncbi:MAG: Ig-like domain repeat protein [Armatimonadetes bacterium]|nr:Ig-like domain repeat protein [Armatimonadota bacterium]
MRLNRIALYFALLLTAIAHTQQHAQKGPGAETTLPESRSIRDFKPGAFRSVSPSFDLPANLAVKSDGSSSWAPEMAEDEAVGPEVQNSYLYRNFAGLERNGQLYSDLGLAVGQNHIVAVNSGGWGIYNKQGERLFSANYNDWFQSTNEFFSPRAFFDPYRSRYVVALARRQVSQQLSFWTFMISKNHNPSSAPEDWWIYNTNARLNSFTDSPQWAADCSIGYDRDAFFIGGNIREWGGTQTFKFFKFRIFEKSLIYRGDPLVWYDLWDFRWNGQTTLNMVMTQSGTYAPGEPTFMVSSFETGGNQIILWRITNVLDWRFHPGVFPEAIQVGSYFPPGLASEPTRQNLIDIQDARIHEKAVYRDGVLDFAQHVRAQFGGGPNEVALKIYRLNVANSPATVVRDVIFGAADYDCFYPSLHHTSNGDVFVVFGRSSHANSEMIGMRTLAWRGNVRESASRLVKAGEGISNKTVWGRYFAVQPDPCDGYATIWTFGQYALENNWGTWIAETSNKYPTRIEETNFEGAIGETITFRARLFRADTDQPIAGRSVSFFVDGLQLATTTTDDQGWAEIDYAIPTNFPLGDHALRTEFERCAPDYNFSTANSTFTVRKADTAIIVEPINAHIGQTITIQARLMRLSNNLPISGRGIAFTLAGQSLGTLFTNADGIASVTYPVPEGGGLGEKALGFAFAGDDRHNPSEASTTLTVRKAQTSIEAVDIVGAVGETITFAGTLTREGDNRGINGRPVVIAIDGSTFGTLFTNSNGQISITYRLPESSVPGDKVLTYTFAGDGVYESTVATKTLTINPSDTTLTVENAEGAAGDTVSIRATLTRNSDGAGISGRPLQIFVGDVGYGTMFTTSTGLATRAFVIPQSLPPGANEIRIVFAGEAVYLPKTSTGTLTVTRVASRILMTGQTVVPGQTTTLSATLQQSGNQQPLEGKTLTFLVAGNVVGTAVTGSNGTASLPYLVPESLGIGDRALRAEFAGDGPYDPSFATATLSITKGATSLAVPNVNGVVGQRVNLTARLTRNVDNTPIVGRAVAFTVNGVSLGSGVTDADGIATREYGISEGAGIGNRTIGASFAGDTHYFSSSNSGTLTVGPSPVTIAVPERAGSVGDTVSISATLRRASDNAALNFRLLTFKVNGQTIGTAFTNPQGHAERTYTITETTPFGNVPIEVSFAGETAYQAGVGNGVLSVTGIGTAIEAEPAAGMVGQSVQLQATLRRTDTNAPMSGRSIKFFIGTLEVGEVDTDVDGIATKTIAIPDSVGSGDLTWTARFVGAGAFLPAEDDAILTVQKAPTTLTLPNHTGQLGVPATIRATLLRSSDSEPIVGREVIFAFNGQPGTPSFTNDDGVASVQIPIPLDLPMGDYPISAQFEGDDAYLASDAAALLTVGRAVSEIIVPTVESSPGQQIMIGATLQREQDEAPLAGRALAFRVNGNPIGQAVTNESGFASVPFYATEGMGIGPKPIEVVYLGDAFTLPSTGHGTLNNNRAPVSIEVQSAIASAGQNVGLIARLRRATDNIVLNNRLLEFYLDGQLVGTATTNANGFASVTAHIPPETASGQQTIEVRFAGDHAYQPGAGQGVLTIRQRAILTAEPALMRLGGETTLRATLRSATDDQPIEGGRIYFTVGDFGFDPVETDENGVAEVTFVVPLDAELGPTFVYAQFEGSNEYTETFDIASAEIRRPLVRLTMNLEGLASSPEGLTARVRVGKNGDSYVYEGALDAQSVFAFESDIVGDGTNISGVVVNGSWLRLKLLDQSIAGVTELQMFLPNGDINGDGAIDDIDLAMLLESFGQTGGAADITRDGTVDDADLSLLLNNFGLVGDGE